MTVSPGRMVGSLALALVLGTMIPIIAVLQISLLAPVLMLCGIVGVHLWARAGWAPAAVLFTAALIAGLVAWLVTHPDDPPLLRAGLWLIAGGGLGNLYDRLATGGVSDFIELAFVRFAVFNVADVCVCLGAALAVIGAILEDMAAGHSPGRQ